MVKLIKEFQRAGFPLTMLKIRKMAFDYAQAHKLLGFNQRSNKAGRSWAKYFLSRHPDIKIKKSHHLSLARAMCANAPNVSKWFDTEYKPLLRELGINSPEQIWNCDETGVTNMPNEDMVLGEVGFPAQKTVACEQGELSTILTYVNGVGNVCPPLVIHKGIRVQQYWEEGKPADFQLAATPSGYIDKHRFHLYAVKWVIWMKTKGFLGRNNVLVLDSHKSHVYNISFLEEMIENKISVISIPPHTSHIVQPLDSVPFAEFKRNWNAEMDEYNFDSHGQALPKGQFFPLLTKVWKRSMSVPAIQAGFRKTGIYPVNFHAIDQRKFGPAKPSDRSRCK